MLQDKAGADLSLAVRDNLTMVNKGFVQSLCLRFHDSHERAQLAYADNLAETRRLMQLLCEMQRLDLLPDPDGASADTDRGGPDLQSTAHDIWTSDLQLATRRLESLQSAQAALKASRSGGAGSPGLDRLIEDAEAFVAELEARSNGIETFGPPDPQHVKSDAEKNTLDDFFGYVQRTEDAFLASKTETPRPDDDPMFAVLNTLLSNHFLAIDQFFLQGFLLYRWNEDALAEGRLKHSVDQMKAAYRTAQRILVLGSVPRSVFLDELRIPYYVTVGSNPLEALQNDAMLSARLIDAMQRGRELAEKAPEPRTVGMLSQLIEVESAARGHVSEQVDALANGTSPGKGTGKFESMLKHWAAA